MIAGNAHFLVLYNFCDKNMILGARLSCGPTGAPALQLWGCLVKSPQGDLDDTIGSPTTSSEMDLNQNIIVSLKLFIVVNKFCSLGLKKKRKRTNQHPHCGKQPFFLNRMVV